MTEQKGEYTANVQVTCIYDYASAQEFLKQHNARVLYKIRYSTTYILDDGSVWSEFDCPSVPYSLKLLSQACDAVL